MVLMKSSAFMGLFLCLVFQFRFAVAQSKPDIKISDNPPLKVLVGFLFLSNLVAAYLYRKYGFIAPLMMRMSFYVVCHIIYGGLIVS